MCSQARVRCARSQSTGRAAWPGCQRERERESTLARQIVYYVYTHVDVYTSGRLLNTNEREKNHRKNEKLCFFCVFNLNSHAR